MRIRVYLDTGIEVFNYDSNTYLFTTISNFEYYNFN